MREIETQKPVIIFFELDGRTIYPFDINIEFDVDAFRVSSIALDNPNTFSLLTSDLFNGDIVCAVPSPNSSNSQSYSKEFIYTFNSPKKIQGTFQFFFKDMSFDNVAQTGGQFAVTLEALKFK